MSRREDSKSINVACLNTQTHTYTLRSTLCPQSRITIKKSVYWGWGNNSVGKVLMAYA